MLLKTNLFSGWFEIESSQIKIITHSPPPGGMQIISRTVLNLRESWRREIVCS